MIIARGSALNDDGSPGELLILGLSDRNVAELLAGRPMRLTKQTHGAGVPGGWSIMIFHGKTEEDCAQMLKDGGCIGPDTKINVDPRLNKT